MAFASNTFVANRREFMYKPWVKVIRNTSNEDISSVLNNALQDLRINRRMVNVNEFGYIYHRKCLVKMLGDVELVPREKGCFMLSTIQVHAELLKSLGDNMETVTRKIKNRYTKSTTDPKFYRLMELLVEQVFLARSEMSLTIKQYRELQHCRGDKYKL